MKRLHRYDDEPEPVPPEWDWSQVWYHGYCEWLVLEPSQQRAEKERLRRKRKDSQRRPFGFG